jgi:hypothetical protein
MGNAVRASDGKARGRGRHETRGEQGARLLGRSVGVFL